MSGHLSYSNTRDLTKFYDKIRLCVDELQLQSEDETTSSSDNNLVNFPEDRLFGRITREEFTKILEAYNAQQKILSLQDKPVTCDRIVGQSYAKLLYSRVGFHHLGSTAHLVRKLGIKDYNRESYLGGRSTYVTKEGEDLKGLRKLEDRVMIKQMCVNAYTFLAKRDFDRAKLEIDKAIKLDDKSGNALAARGKYYAEKGDHNTAVEDYSLAIKFKSDDMIGLHRDLSVSFFNLALDYYHRKNYEVALRVFQESLNCDPENENARLHIGLCNNKIHAKSAFKSGVNQYRDG